MKLKDAVINLFLRASASRIACLNLFRRIVALCACLLIVNILAGCSSSGHRAPVVERGEAANKRVVPPPKNLREKDWRPQVHVVQKGETLYSIAFNYGFDYHELAELNGIQNPGVISVGQEIRLFPGSANAIARPGTAEGASRSSGASAGVAVAGAVENKPVAQPVKEQPKLVKYPYSEAAMAQIVKVQEPTKPVVSAVVADKAESKPDNKPDSAADDGEEAALEWSMPTNGRLIGEFSESANRKGIDIAGKLGQPVTASASGKVVYSGSGLRGYGKLVIIKHNKSYLSAYAHNDKVLVKEGQTVTRGQKIAEMGNTDADQVKLHFEVRYLGKPVDPAKFLPLGKS
jgi:lipoprotein NlpD